MSMPTEPTTNDQPKPLLFEYPCDTPGCAHTYKASKYSRRRYCDLCIALKVTQRESELPNGETT